MLCCSRRAKLTDDDRKAVNAWTKYEQALKRAHTCLHELKTRDIDAFKEWTQTQKGSKAAGRLASLLRTASRRQGADIPYTHIMDKVSLKDVVSGDTLRLLTSREKTACRHFARFNKLRGSRTQLAEIDLETLEKFQAFLASEGRVSLGQRYNIITHIRSAVIKAGGHLETRRNRSSVSGTRSKVVQLYGNSPLVLPYLAYLRERWKHSTFTSIAHQYRLICDSYVSIVARCLGVDPRHVEPHQLLNFGALDQWMLTVSRKRASQKKVAARAITGFFAFWGSELDSEKLGESIARVKVMADEHPAKSTLIAKRSDSDNASYLSELSDAYVKALHVRGFSSSAESAVHAIRRFLRWCERQTPRITDPRALTREILDDYICDLVTCYTESSNTLNNYLNRTGGYWQWLYNRDLLPSFTPEAVPTGKPRIRPRALSHEQARALIRAVQSHDCHETTLKRNLAWIILGLATGPRGIEVRNLTFHDVDFNHLWIRYHSEKGRRIVPLPEVAAACLEEYIRVRGKCIHGTDRIFLGGNGAFKRPISKDGFGDVFRFYRDMAGIPRKFGGFHCLRHSFAQSLAENDRLDPLHIKELLGHNSLSATEMYLTGSPHSGQLLGIDTSGPMTGVVLNV